MDSNFTISSNERDFIISALRKGRLFAPNCMRTCDVLSQDTRIDGRQPLAMRGVKIMFGDRSGSATVHYGRTRYYRFPLSSLSH